MAALLTTLFVPTVVLLVPLYIEIVHPPLIGGTYVDSYWAIWLPEAASAFNVVLMKRFFDNLPREIFEAARIDGAGKVRLFLSIVLPMSKPILGVVSKMCIRDRFSRTGHRRQGCHEPRVPVRAMVRDNVQHHPCLLYTSRCV